MVEEQTGYGLYSHCNWALLHVSAQECRLMLYMCSAIKASAAGAKEARLELAR